MLHRFLCCLALCCGFAAIGDAATVNMYMFTNQQTFASYFTTDSTGQQINPSVTIHVGDTIHWVLASGVHCTTACAGMSESWASGIISTVGQSFDHTFTHSGAFGYYCCIHGIDNGNGTGSGMSGLITVLPASATGTITLQNFSGSMPSVTIEVRNPGSTVPLNSYNVTPAADGSFSFPAPDPGTYDIAFKASHWLRKTLANVVVTSTGVSGLAPSLRNGDVNGDNAVTLGDFSALRLAFGSTPGDPNWNPNADLNGDGGVTLGDFTILRSNFGQQGDP